MGVAERINQFGAKVRKLSDIRKKNHGKSVFPVIFDVLLQLLVVHLLSNFCPYILAQGAVLGLRLESRLVLWLLDWVFHACRHSSSQLSPVGAILFLFIADWCGALSVGCGVVLT